MRVPACAWGLSVLPAFLERSSHGELAVAGASRLGLALLPWLALAGLPERAAGARRPAARALAAVALALPPLGLAAALDQGDGARTAVLVHGLLVGALLVFVLRWAAGRAGADGAYGLAWLVLVPGSAALLVALRWASLPGSAGPGTLDAALAWLNPLVWCFDGARAWTWTQELRWAVPGPLATVAILGALAARPARDEVLP